MSNGDDWRREQEERERREQEERERIQRKDDEKRETFDRTPKPRDVTDTRDPPPKRR